MCGHGCSGPCARQLGSNARRSEARMTEGEGQHALLDERRCCIRHPRLAAFPGPQDLRSEAEQLSAPGVVGRWVDPHGAAGGADVAEFGGQGKDSQAKAKQCIIVSHGGAPWVG